MTAAAALTLNNGSEMLIDTCKAASNGGGIYFASSTLTVPKTTIKNVLTTTAAVNGGGVYVASGTITLAGATISGNSANSGGGIYLAGSGIAEMSDSSISGNSASKGNGVYIKNTATLKIKGGSSVDDGNDVYIEMQTNPGSHQGTIWVDGTLSQTAVATITPSNYQPIYVLSGTASDVEAAMIPNPKFKLKQPDAGLWGIDKTGRLLKPSTINCIIGAGELKFSSANLIIRKSALVTTSFEIMAASHTVFRQGSSPTWRWRLDGTSKTGGSVIYYDASSNVSTISQGGIEYAKYSIPLSSLPDGVSGISIELIVDGIIYSGNFRITVTQ
jgi:hypothetical protein